MIHPFGVAEYGHRRDLSIVHVNGSLLISVLFYDNLSHMTKIKESKGYCSECGSWATDCKTIIIYSIPEKVCFDCRESKGL
jgi:hypothetical protein